MFTCQLCYLCRYPVPACRNIALGIVVRFQRVRKCGSWSIRQAWLVCPCSDVISGISVPPAD
jgi:hypothetical protein